MSLAILPGGAGIHRDTLSWPFNPANSLRRSPLVLPEGLRAQCAECKSAKANNLNRSGFDAVQEGPFHTIKPGAVQLLGIVDYGALYVR